ncbi:hypothetical protein BBP40_003527 [Aspergillus hancockii]|nr:hypothetical protein BBP40_003527 [Aspergillus hancockii]
MDKANILGRVGEKIARSLSQEKHNLDEDCLAINIWTKPQQGEQKKAVLFYIHGGAYWLGSGSLFVTDGSILADENDVVVVSFNYRLSIFGFSGAPGQPWNVGLMDQRLALEWTRANIAAFGGDPFRITVLGQSVGGVSADMLAFSYPNDPIAHAFIAMSGVASSYMSAAMQGKYPRAAWYKVSAKLGCGGPEAGEATVRCMKNKSQDVILAAIRLFGKPSPIAPFWPVPDGNLVPRNYETEGNAGSFARVPFLTGSADREMGLFFSIPLMYSDLTEDQVAAIPRLSGLEEAGSCWHASDVFILFGTASSITGVADREDEAKAAAYMRNAWTTFAKEPQNGLNTRLHWPQNDPSGKSQIQLSLGRQAEPSYIFNWKTDMLCPVVALFKDIYLDILMIISWLVGVQKHSSLMGNLTGLVHPCYTVLDKAEPVADVLYQALDNEEQLRIALESLRDFASRIEIGDL